MGGQVGIDDALGIVECFVAAIGNKDSVGDIIIPGAFNKSLKRRKPRVVWGHDWNQPIGKVIDIFEVGPSDPRLPMKMKQAGVGAVYARVQLNLKSERGREAFSFVQFFGEEQEWSIGYKTLDAVFDPKLQANILKELELYEVSPVLHGANQLTSTLSVKDDKCGNMRTGMPVAEGGVMLDSEESDLRDSLLKIVSMHGRFNEDAEGVWAGYTPAAENEVASIGVKCSNCVFYNGDGSCDIIAMDIEPGGKCRFAVIPKGVVDVSPSDEMSTFDLDGWGDEEQKIGNSPGNSQIENLVSLVPGGDRAQSQVEGRVPGGHGGGNLATLLRYWRKIMVQEGGFRRCRVILADHPELYPLNNICAWLHHETTGLWPNEGCHHPGMKNCRRKFKKLGKKPSKPTLWSESEFLDRLPGKSMMDMTMGYSMMDDDGMDQHEVAGMAATMLKKYMSENPDWVAELNDESNWTHEGQDDNGDWHEHPWLVGGGSSSEGDCGCGCGGSKSAFEDDLFGTKAGRVLSSSNIAKLKQAAELINEVITVGEVQFKGAAFILSVEDASDLVSHIAPVVRNYDLSVSVKSQTVTIDGKNMTTDAATAIGNAIGSYTEWVDEDGYSVKGLAGMDPNARDADGDGMVQDNTVYQRPAGPKKLVSAAVSGLDALRQKSKQEALKKLKDEEPTTVVQLFKTLDSATDEIVSDRVKVPGAQLVDGISVLDCLPVTNGFSGEKIRDYTSKDGSISIPMELWRVIKKQQYGGGPDANKFRAGEYWLNAEQLDNFQAEARKKAQELREIYSDIWKEMPKVPKGGADQFLSTQSTTDGAVKRMFSDKAPKVSPKEAMAAVIVKWETMASLIEENKKKIAAFQARVLEAQKSLLKGGASFNDHKDWLAPVASYHGIGYTVKGDRVFYDTDAASVEALEALEKAIGSVSQ
jgi:HK97 family phage prohead protease